MDFRSNKELTNEQWLVYQIEHATELEKLTDISLIIDYDKWEDVEYTKDPDAMAMIRKAWVKRRDELNSRNLNRTA